MSKGLRVGVIMKLDDVEKKLHLLGDFGTCEDWMMGANTIVLDNAQEITGVFNWQHEADILKFAERKGYQIIKDPVPESYLKNNE